VKTYVEGREFYPVVLQVFDRKTEVRIEGVHMPNAEGLSSGGSCAIGAYQYVKQAEVALRICFPEEGWVILYTLATSDSMTQRGARMHE